MSLARFSIIVTIDGNGGISRQGEQPWISQCVERFWRDTTIGKRRNAIIMGRKTYMNIPTEFRPLEHRHCVILSKKWRQEDHPDIAVHASIPDALAALGNTTKYENVFVVGGESIFQEIVRDYLYLCDRIYLTKFKNVYGCDQFFPYDSVKMLPQIHDPYPSRDYVRYTFSPKDQLFHGEYSYLEALESVVNEGETTPEENGIGMKCVFGLLLQFDMSTRLPVITTRKIELSTIIKELIWCIKGSTDANGLSDEWIRRTSDEALKQCGLSDLYKGDAGPYIGYQWRHFGEDYPGYTKVPEVDYDVPIASRFGFDQLDILIQNLKQDPFSTHHLLVSWNPMQAHQSSFKPPPIVTQFSIDARKENIDCMVYLHSVDMFNDAPHFITFFALLASLVGHICNVKPRSLKIVTGKSFVYSHYIGAVKKQLSRTPRPFPEISFRNVTKLHELEDFTEDSFIITNYDPWPTISPKMIV